MRITSSATMFQSLNLVQASFSFALPLPASATLTTRSIRVLTRPTYHSQVLTNQLVPLLAWGLMCPVTGRSVTELVS